MKKKIEAVNSFVIRQVGYQGNSTYKSCYQTTTYWHKLLNILSETCSLYNNINRLY